jgi:flagellar hook-length control protein FliK
MEAVQMMTAVATAEVTAVISASTSAPAEGATFDAMMIGQTGELPAEASLPTEQASDLSAQELVSAQIMAMIGNLMPAMTTVDQVAADVKQAAAVRPDSTQQQLPISPAQFMTGIALLQGMPAVKAAVEEPVMPETAAVPEVEGLPVALKANPEISMLPKEVKLPVAEAGLLKPVVKAEEEILPTEAKSDAVSRIVMPEVAQGPEKAAEKSRLVQQVVQVAAKQPAVQLEKPVEPVVASNQDVAKVQQEEGQDAAVQVVSAQAKSTMPETQVRTASVVADPVRFAKSPDVVMAAVQVETAGEQQAGTQDKPEEQQMAFKGKDAAKPAIEALDAPVAQVRGTEQLAGQQGISRQFQVAESRPVAPQAELHAVIPEQVARQVSDRIISAEPKGGSEQISLRLSPEHLGNLQMNLKMENQKLHVEIVAEHRSVRDAILQQADTLKETLSRQNIQVDSFDVTTSGNAMQQQFKDWRQTQDNQHQQPGQQASNRISVAARGFVETPVRYFEKQYNSTIDLRF